MKRKQQSFHRLVWLLMIPILGGTIAVAMIARPTPEDQLNDELPSFLVKER